MELCFFSGDGDRFSALVALVGMEVEVEIA